MAEKTVKPLQVLVKGFNLRDIVKEDFIESLENEFDSEIKTVNLLFSVNDGEKRRIIALSHVRPVDEEESIMIIDAPTTDILTHTVNVIKDYGE